MAAEASSGTVEDPALLHDYLIDRMLTGYEQDDDVTMLIVHKTRDHQAAI